MSLIADRLRGVATVEPVECPADGACGSCELPLADNSVAGIWNTEPRLPSGMPTGGHVARRSRNSRPTTS